MPPEVVRPQFDSGQFACLLDNHPGGSIRDRENPLIWFKRSLLDVRAQTLNHLSQDEDDFSILAALWALDRQLLVADIFRSELQDFTASHAASRHELQDKAVSHLRRPEDNLINRFFFDDIPVDGFAGSIDLPQHRGIAGILNAGLEVGPDEIEKGLEM